MKAMREKTLTMATKKGVKGNNNEGRISSAPCNFQMCIGQFAVRGFCLSWIRADNRARKDKGTNEENH